MIYWNSVGEFLSMGGYGLYVWGSCLATAAVIAGEIWSARRRLKRARLTIALGLENR